MIFFMTHLSSSATSRTLTVVLSEADWQALRAVEPDAVGWLHERIRERLGATESTQASARVPQAAGSGPGWGDDEY